MPLFLVVLAKSSEDFFRVSQKASAENVEVKKSPFLIGNKHL
jgi:hypothetical protein